MYSDLIKLINSLSKEEKRVFRLNTKKQSGTKDYEILFDLINNAKAIDEDEIKKEFNQKRPDVIIDNPARYLFKLLTDSLIDLKIKNDKRFKIYQGLMRINVLRERSLTEEALKEVKRIRSIAEDTQDYLLQLKLINIELHFLSDNQFRDIKEKTLIDLQTKASNIIKDISVIQEHSSLYQVLKYRLIYAGDALSQKEADRLNDLILSEINILSGRMKHNFESRKLHLLFQSFLFSNAGDYDSALVSFRQLGNLFVNNEKYWSTPPIDYFSSLEGILDSLRAARLYDEMEYYIQRLEFLNKDFYPEHFIISVKKTILIHKLFTLSQKNKISEATELLNKSKHLLTANGNVREEKHIELIFYSSLICLKNKEYKTAHKYLNSIILVGKVNYLSLIYRSCFLLSLITSYKEKNYNSLDYDLKVYKRTFKNKGRFLKTERLVLKTINLQPNKNKQEKNKLLLKKIKPLISSIEKDKYERQLLRYFDFVAWVVNEFEK